MGARSLGLSLFYIISQTVWVIRLNLFSFNAIDLKVFFYLDWVRIFFSFIVLIISSIVLKYRDSYMMSEIGRFKFIYLMLLFIFSMLIMVMSSNMTIILLGWDGLGLVSFLLVIYYQSEVSNSAGIITVLTNRIGDVGIILSIVFIMSLGDWDFLILNTRESLLGYVGGFIFIGAVTKSAQLPFSAWLPAAIAAPTPVSSLVHSSTLVTAGVYLVIRLNMYFGSSNLGFLLFSISVLTMFMSGFGANLENDLKKIIALSTLSQLGVIIITLSVGFYQLAFFHLCTHAVFKATLFYAQVLLFME